MKILVVDDDLELMGLIGFALRQTGYLVIEAADGVEALSTFQREQPDLVILDVNLPGLSGFEVCRRIRAEAPTPVMLLTVRSSEDDQVRGLDGGADDYLTKPFSPRELVARVKTVLRRAAGGAAAEPAALQVGDVRLDPGRRRAWAAGAEVSLTATEFDLLAFLMRRPGRVYEREQLLSQVWGYAAAAGTRTVDVHVAQLRAKLGVASPIRTVRGVGYSAEVPEGGHT